MVENESIDQLEKIIHFIDADILKNDHRPKVPNLVGKSRIMKDVFSKIKKVSSKDLNVLIEGESGTGKELAARTIHELSSRRNKPFVKINLPSFKLFCRFDRVPFITTMFYSRQNNWFKVT